MNRWLARFSIVSALLVTAALTAHAAASNTWLAFHIPALEGDVDVASAYVQLNWSDGSHTVVALPNNVVEPVGILVADGTRTGTNKLLSTVVVYGDRLVGGTFSQSAVARLVVDGKYDLLVGGLLEGSIVLEPILD